jgi:hypothetical protein
MAKISKDVASRQQLEFLIPEPVRQLIKMQSVKQPLVAWGKLTPTLEERSQHTGSANMLERIRRVLTRWFRRIANGRAIWANTLQRSIRSADPLSFER